MSYKIRFVNGRNGGDIRGCSNRVKVIDLSNNTHYLPSCISQVKRSLAILNTRDIVSQIMSHKALEHSIKIVERCYEEENKCPFGDLDRALIQIGKTAKRL